jgi:predicted component of type VI protein secretion system
MSVSTLANLTETTSVQEALAVLRVHGVQVRYENFIGGNWVAAIKGNYFLDKTPIDGEPLCEVAFSSAAMLCPALLVPGGASNPNG